MILRLTVDRNFQPSFQNDRFSRFSLTTRFQGQPTETFLMNLLIGNVFRIWAVYDEVHSFHLDKDWFIFIVRVWYLSFRIRCKFNRSPTTSMLLPCFYQKWLQDDLSILLEFPNIFCQKCFGFEIDKINLLKIFILGTYLKLLQKEHGIPKK